MAAHGQSEGIIVRCRCGVETPVANRWMADTLTCRACGGKLHMSDENTRSEGERQHSAILDAALHADPSTRNRMAARFVQEEKYDEAEVIYREILAAQPQHRDARYGLGFIAYKRGHWRESMALLREAVALGHPTAMRLVLRISDRLGAMNSEG